MRSINPLYLLALLTVLVLFVGYESMRSKEELRMSIAEYERTKELTHKLLALKKAYDGSKSKKLAGMLKKEKRFKAVKLQQSASALQMRAKRVSVAVLNALLAKVLNDNYRITRFELKRLGSKYVSFTLEIAL